MERNLGELLQRQRLCRNVAEPRQRRQDEVQEQLLLGYFNIPRELAVEILRRLPIKSLLRFRLVSKSWKSCLDSKYFIDSHLRRPPPATASDDDWLVAVLGPQLYHGLKVVDKASFTKLFEFNLPEVNFLELSFIGTCNGLICFQAIHGDPGYSIICTKMVHLWNPVRGIDKIIHTCELEYKSTISQLPFTDYGFGYDSCNNEYKVVKLEHHHCTKSKSCSYANMVYSLSTNSWRAIQSTPPATSCPHRYSHGGKPPLPLVNGATHWLADRRYSGKSVNNSRLLPKAEGTNGLVISFNFHDEVFREISLPISSSKRGTTLVSYKSSLAVMVPDCDDHFFPAPPHCNWTFHLWVMKEYGVTESWTKSYSIDLPKLNAFVRQPCVRFRGFGEDENELVFSAFVQNPNKIGVRNPNLVGGFVSRGVYFVEINCNSSLQPTVTSISARLLYYSEYPITFRPSLVSFSTDKHIGA